jgi:CheY-like chemotaxis protein
MWEDKHSVALVVEDEMLLQLHAAGLLQEHGFAVVEAANAADACQAIKSSGGKVRARP